MKLSKTKILGIDTFILLIKKSVTCRLGKQHMGGETWMYESVTKHLCNLAMTGRERERREKERRRERMREGKHLRMHEASSR